MFPCISAGRVARASASAQRGSLKAPGCKQYLGAATRFRRPWFRADYDDGDKEELSGHELARVMVPSPADFLDPLVWYCDFSIIHPLIYPTGV